MTRRLFAAALGAGWLLTVCVSCTPGVADASNPIPLQPVVIGAIPAPADAFVEGLAWMDDTHVLMSTGAADQPSALRVLSTRTGAVTRSVTVPGVFAEGVAVVRQPGQRPIVRLLTWQDRIVATLDQGLVERGRQPLVATSGQGWGLCSAGRTLWSSDGTAVLTRRDPQTMTPIGQVTVTLRGKPVANLNALAADDDGRLVWANIWPTDMMVRVDTSTGAVVSTVDLSGLHEHEHPSRDDPDAVPNGVLVDPHGGLWVTGKRWPRILHVQLEPAA